MKKLNYILLLIPLLLLLESNSCRNVKYDMTGGRKFDDSVTVSVMTFTNSAPLAKPTLAQTLTESLKDFIQRQTRLTLIPSNGDLQYEGEITGYSISPVAISAGSTDQASLNRLTITVKVDYTDGVDEKFSFSGSFSRFSDYPSTQDISAVEEQLVRDISDQLTQDIMNRSINAW